MRLHYTGGGADPDTALPLPEGWPAADHDEPDAAVAAAKAASGLYRGAGAAASPAGGEATSAPEKRGARHQAHQAEGD